MEPRLNTSQTPKKTPEKPSIDVNYEEVLLKWGINIPQTFILI